MFKQRTLAEAHPKIPSPNFKTSEPPAQTKSMLGQQSDLQISSERGTWRLSFKSIDNLSASYCLRWSKKSLKCHSIESGLIFGVSKKDLTGASTGLHQKASPTPSTQSSGCRCPWIQCCWLPWATMSKFNCTPKKPFLSIACPTPKSEATIELLIVQFNSWR